MRFDTVIIGGGLAGLVCGIRLQKAGKKCAIIAAGQNAMHFSSGYFDLLNKMPDGTEVDEPLKAIESLGAEHPYSKIGKSLFEKYLSETAPFFRNCGISLNGNPEKNGFRISPTGEFRRTWLGLDEFKVLESDNERPGKKVLIANIEGYLDFNTSFIADALEEKGIGCKIIPVRLDEMERLRKNPSEMRSTNIAKVMEHEEVRAKAVKQIKDALTGEDAVILPALFGISDSNTSESLKEEIGKDIYMVATMPPSVPGIRSQMRMKAEFENAGGISLHGDTACRPEINNGKVTSISTVNFDDIRLYADNFILASGSFFSKGLNATPDRISETVFDLDIDASTERKDWYDTEFFARQNYISFGVRTDKDFRCYKDGKIIENLYAAGSILSGCNALYEGCGAGTAIFSAFKVSDTILESSEK